MTAAYAASNARSIRLLEMAYGQVGLVRRQAARDFTAEFLAEHPAIEAELCDLTTALLNQALRESWQHAGFTYSGASTRGDATATAEELGAQFLARRAELVPALALATSRQTGGR